ncbi:hypothetical protein [Ideonella sp. BN130291]|uniref:hypothetical protein n=1 Tax=Ideonella sp. BN130291 TaxID=3112940 RepID=UPI002E270E93|nr:hypothetical protein [Ideonella sp. BN130291]
MPRTPFTFAVLGCAALSAQTAGASLPAGCKPLAPQQVVESFLSADCAACWQQPDPASTVTGPRTLRLDWIVPGDLGDDAPLAAAALPEAKARLKTPLVPADSSVQQQRLPSPLPGVQLAVQSGLAWNGYIGLAFDLRQGRKPLPADAQGWVALVERVPAGQDGSAVQRQLVRALAGPLPLTFAPGQRQLQHLRAVLVPPNSRGERLAAVGWIASANGRMLMAAQSAPAGCATPE